MPITPLHFGVMAPINYIAKDKVSNVSFVIANIWLDMPSIVYALFEIGGFSHANHTLLNALLIGLLLSMANIGDKRWVLGAFLGTFTHVLLDAVVHRDVILWGTDSSGVSLYLGYMTEISLILVPLTVWWAVQCRSYIRAKIGMH